MRILDKYKGFPRRIKPFYVLNNLLNIRYLKRNKTLYKKIGLNRAVWRSLRHSVLKNLNEAGLTERAEMKRPELLSDELLDSWNKNGMIVLKGYFSNSVLALNKEIEGLIHSGKVGFNFTRNKIVFANRQSELIRSIERDHKLMEVLSYLLGKEAIPFQTINFINGSEQRAHSDSIHMSTFPEGYLIAAWIALDEISNENGPVYYYPGSHKWPYFYNEDIGLKESALLLDENPNRRYEETLESFIKSRSIEPEVFYAQPGDMLIWHANLVHGGSLHAEKNKTRRSMVMHYFGKDVICYHELTQRPAIIK